MAASMDGKLEKWICVEMSKLLGIDANQDLARYILDIETRPELEEYIYGFLDYEDPKQKRFMDQLLRKWRPPERKIDNPLNLQAYRKTDGDPDYFSGPEKTKKKGRKSQSSTQLPANITQNHVQERTPDAKLDSSPPKGKAKFVPLFGEEGQLKTGARLPGRHPCECQAAKHKLINNCLKCGRVVCDQEGSGPCLFCGTLVCTMEELEVLNRGSKKSEKLRESLNCRGQGGMLSSNGYQNAESVLNGGMQESYEKAVKHKDRLLHYDKTSVKRTQVIDDEADYFTTDGNMWLNQKDKALLKKREDELRQKKHGSRLDRKVTLDFAGRQVLDAEDEVDLYNINDDVVQEVHYGKGKKSIVKGDPAFKSEDFGELVNPNIKQDAPKFVPVGNAEASKKTATYSSVIKKGVRIQDRELQEMSDDGMCLSMHQPWASLLTNGIKIHEGRTWYTAHRGRLYIAATAKTPTSQEIASVEQQYRVHYNDARIEFPEDYPVGCLLGCVDVVDCLSEEEYVQKFPQGESNSPYVFICENPQDLVVKFPIKGKHKIYKLESHVHQAAKRGLQPVKSKIRRQDEEQILSDEGDL